MDCMIVCRIVAAKNLNDNWVVQLLAFMSPNNPVIFHSEAEIVQLTDVMEIIDILKRLYKNI